MRGVELRWMAIVVPVIGIGALDLITDHEWSDLVAAPMTTMLVPVLGLAFAIAVARVAFDRIDRLAATVRDRDAALEREIAIRGERERIAREMHDGLAQVLGYVNTKAQAVEELLAVGQTSDARRQLTELAAAARSVYVDVRESILGLANPVVGTEGLVPALETYAQQFSEASKIAVSVEASPAVRALDIGTETQAQLYRVVQEALRNVRKHAAAHRVRLQLDAGPQELLVEVIDDGVGFTLAAPETGDWPHYGMRAMRERARSIGASADWSSTIDAGTTFRLHIPLETGARA